MSEVRVKVRETTRDTTFTVPVSPEQAHEFFHDPPWDELHVVHKETKQLLVVYTRNQLLTMYCGRKKEQEKKHRSGVKIAVFSTTQVS